MSIRKKWFTLVEMLIVVVVIGVLITALVPKLQNSLARTRNSKRTMDMRALYNSMKIYITDRWDFPSTANKLIWTYLTSLPADPSWRSACKKPYAWGDYGSIMARDMWGLYVDASNKYDLDKWYYYTQLATWYFVPWRNSPNAPKIALIWSYMEKISKVPVSNVPFSSEKFVQMQWYGRWSACPDYAIWTLSAWLWVWFGSATSSYYQLPAPEAINTPEITSALDIITQDYYDSLMGENNDSVTNTYTVGGNGSAWGGGSTASYTTYRYDVSEWDYLMLVTK